jgi:hypothetical protein
MGIVVAETVGSWLGYRFADADAFLSYENSACDAPWVTRAGRSREIGERHVLLQPNRVPAPEYAGARVLSGA